MRLEHWIDDNGGLVHRDAAAGAGFSREVQRRAVGEGRLRRVRRAWLATPSAPADLTAAAGSGTRVTCVSMARRRSWWLPEGIDDRLHLSVDPHGATPEVDSVRHWTARIAPAPVHLVIESFEDALGHIATCQPPETALVIWESAIRLERIAPEALRRIRWTSVAARECAENVTGLSDSGLETLVVVRLRPWRVRIRQQIVVAGERVDLLVGERLILQIDGYAHHSSAAQRGRDVAADAELVLRGYTVLRFTYAQIVHEWRSVERVIARAIASGAHLAT